MAFTVRGLWNKANNAKNVFEWVSIAGAIWMPGALTSLPIIKDQPWDIVALYAVLGMAFWIIYIVEAKPILTLLMFPLLDVARALTPDTEMCMFRLRVRCVSRRPATLVAHLEWIEADGHSDHEAHTPLELRWMHRPDLSSPSMTVDRTESVDVAYVIDRGTVAEKLIFTGKLFQAHTLLMPAMNEPRDLAFCVRITVTETGLFHERAFRLEPDNQAPLGWYAVRLTDRERASA